MERYVKQTICSESNLWNLHAARTRDSIGNVSILLHFAGRTIEFDDEEEYENMAREAAKLLLEMCDDKCEL